MILMPIVHGTNNYFCNKVLIHAYDHIMKLYSASTHVSTLICLTGSFFLSTRYVKAAWRHYGRHQHD
uniref:Uncharacterized protein n=1 Tax=Triticum urartu TaxID=4572 RepID=A0A8R7VBK0_TRIUA